MTKKVFVKAVYCDMLKRLIHAVHCKNCGFDGGSTCDFHEKRNPKCYMPEE